MDGLEELAGRCEQATGSDRALDLEIAMTVGAVPETYERAVQHGIPQPYFWHKTMHKEAYFVPDHYTASLDAALTLVPEGCGVSIQRYWTSNHDGPVWSAELAFGGVPSNPRRVHDAYDAATPALAVCAGALRARALASEQVQQIGEANE